MEQTEIQNAMPMPDEKKQIYVTLNSARKAGIELAAIATNRYDAELEQHRRKVVAEIIDTYIPYAKPSGKDELANLRLVTDIPLYHGNGEERRYFDLNFYSIHEPIKQLENPVEVSLTHFLAITTLEDRLHQLKARQNEMADEIFAELMYMKRKECIEIEFPEAMEYLEFAPYYFDAAYLRDVCSERAKAEYKARRS